MIDDSSKARGFIAGVIAIGIVVLAAALFFFTPSQASLAVLTGLLSALTLALGAVVQFYFGSSSGAKTLVASQNQTMQTLAEAVSNSTPVVNGLTGASPTGKPDDPVAVKEVPKEIEDPRLANFRAFVKKMNPVATEADVQTAWAPFKDNKVDIDPTK